MSKVLKWLGISILVLIGVIFIVGLIINKPLPQGQEGEQADSLARCMLNAINDSAWQQTQAVTWTFPGGHKYLWDRDRHWVRVEWGAFKVLLRINSKTGRVWKEGGEITDNKKRDKLLDKAWKFWVNDSFWLNAPAKVFDPGTKRVLVPQEEGKQALLVTYTQGGATPGDSYLWHLDEDNLPESWQLWVNVIPVGGIEFTWENWQTLSTGARIATTHKQSVFTLELTEIKGARSLSDLGKENAFELLEE